MHPNRYKDLCQYKRVVTVVILCFHVKYLVSPDDDYETKTDVVAGNC